jgi:hypothetical protein
VRNASAGDRLCFSAIAIKAKVVSKPQILFESPAKQKRDFTSWFFMYDVFNKRKPSQKRSHAYGVISM